MQATFKVKYFPFEPFIALYKFTEESFEHGYRINELIVEDIYNHRYIPDNRRADTSLGKMIYEDGMYHYEIKIVLQTPGVYSTFMGDAFNETLKDFQVARLEEVLAQIEFEEYCGASFSPKTVIKSGDPHYDDFLEELIHLDRVIYANGINDLGEILESGSRFIEWSGVFLFEVTP